MTDVTATINMIPAAAQTMPRVRGYWGNVWNKLRYDYVTLFLPGG